MTTKHIHRFATPHRGWRRCRTCRQQQFTVEKDLWRDEMTLPQFADSWLPTITGIEPKTLMDVEVAFPFEWNCYESWKPVWRVTFNFNLSEVRSELATRIDVMDGWQSKWQECWVRIDHEARNFYYEKTGRLYAIGDNTYEEMRRVIQS